MDKPTESRTKRPRDDERPDVSSETSVSSKVEIQDHNLTKEADKKQKKSRLETPIQTPSLSREPPSATDSESTDCIDAEIVLMHALEEAIEKDAAAASKGSVPIVVDENDDYDESD